MSFVGQMLVKKPGKRLRVSEIAVLLLAVACVATAFLVMPGQAPAAANTGAAGGGKAAPVAGMPVITELMASNRGTVTNGAGEYVDWIELFNPTDKPINLSGIALSDNLKKPKKFILPDVMLEPGEYTVIFADGQPSSNGELHAPFKLKNGNQMLLMVGPDGHELQRIGYPETKPDCSWARNATTGKWAETEQCTPGFSNDGDGYAAYLKSRRAEAPVAFSEVMAGNVLTLMDGDGDASDWVEISNPSGTPADMTGWGLSDRETEPKRWVFPETQIAPGGYLLVFCSGKNKADAGKELHTNFKLDAGSGTVLLSNPRGQIVSEVQIHNLKSDESLGLAPGADAVDALSRPTPGYPNTDEGWDAFQQTLYAKEGGAPIIITEVMSCNASTLKDQFRETPDWIELYNRSNKSVNLKNWGLTGKSDELGRWLFPDITLGPGQYLIVYASGRNLADGDAVAKRNLHTDFTIGVGGGTVVLTSPDGRPADHCFVPALRAGVSYGRESGSMLFGYMPDPTPGGANGSALTGAVPDPVFSLKPGLYTGEQQITLTSGSGAEIYYTLDGKAPAKDSKRYAGPIGVKKSTVIRAIAYRDGYLPSRAVSSTYLIDLNGFFGAEVELPVVSIAANPSDLSQIDENIHKDIEKPAHAELIEPDGTVGFSQNIGIKLFGGVSRENSQKSYALMSRGAYGSGTFDYQVFPELPYTSYKDLLLRASGQDFLFSRIRDDLFYSLLKGDADADIQAHRQCLVFINGEYWGVYDLMEKLNEHFIAQHYSLDPGKIDLLYGNGAVSAGSNTDYKALVKYVKEHDMSQKANYDYVSSKMDVDSYIDWCCVEIFTVNSDLGNIKYWRPQTPEGKWRWILYDFDYCYFFVDQPQYDFYADPFKRFFDPEGNGIRKSVDNTLARGLIKNPEFRQKFIERFAHFTNVTFSTQKVLQRVDEAVEIIKPYMQKDFDKWNKSTVSKWLSSANKVALIKDFAIRRPEMNKRCFQRFFNLSDAEMKRLFGS